LVRFAFVGRYGGTGAAQKNRIPFPLGKSERWSNYLECRWAIAPLKVFPVVIEIPKGDTNKFEYDKELHVFKLDGIASPVHYSWRLRLYSVYAEATTAIR